MEELHENISSVKTKDLFGNGKFENGKQSGQELFRIPDGEDLAKLKHNLKNVRTKDLFGENSKSHRTHRTCHFWLLSFALDKISSNHSKS